MPRNTKTALADAHQANRDLRNQLHDAELRLQPLRERIRELERDLVAATRRAETSERKRRVSRAAVDALIGMLHEESGREP